MAGWPGAASPGAERSVGQPGRRGAARQAAGDDRAVAAAGGQHLHARAEVAGGARRRAARPAAAPLAATRPPSSSSSRSANCPARVRSCTADRTVSDRSRRSSSTSSSASTRRPRSRALVGSSSSRTGACWASARARTSRCSSPPDSVRSARPARADRASRSISSRADPPVGVGLDPEVADVRRAAEQHVVADRHVRRQLRLLRDVGDQAGQLPPGHPGDRLAADRDAAVVAGPGGRRPAAGWSCRRRWGRSRRATRRPRRAR